MSVSKSMKYGAPLSTEDRRVAAWETATKTEDPLVRIDHRGLQIHWDQWDKRCFCGWFIEFIQPLEEGGKDEANNLRARHWCDSLEQFEAALLMEP